MDKTINLNGLIVRAADYKVVLIISTSLGLGNRVFYLQTLQEISWSIKKENELVYAIGTVNAIANVSNAKSHEGRMSAQAGEIFSILQLAGLPDTTEIENATLSIASVKPGFFTKTFSAMNIFSEDFSTRAKDKDSRIDMSFTALSAI